MYIERNNRLASLHQAGLLAHKTEVVALITPPPPKTMRLGVGNVTTESYPC